MAGRQRLSEVDREARGARDEGVRLPEALGVVVARLRHAAYCQQSFGPRPLAAPGGCRRLLFRTLVDAGSGAFIASYSD